MQQGVAAIGEICVCGYVVEQGDRRCNFTGVGETGGAFNEALREVARIGSLPSVAEVAVCCKESLVRGAAFAMKLPIRQTEIGGDARGIVPLHVHAKKNGR